MTSAGNAMADGPQTARRRRIEISGMQVAASALAAVTAAFLLSTLGAAGTVAGAAITSIMATGGSAVYVHFLRRAGEQIRDVRAQLGPETPPGHGTHDIRERRGTRETRDSRDSRETVVLPVFAAEALAGLREAPPAPGAEPAGRGAESPGRRPELPGPGPESPGRGSEPAGRGTGAHAPSAGAGRGRVRAARVLLAAAVVFVVAMAGVTAIEAATGRSFPSLFGHDDRSPSITQIGGSSGGGHAPATPRSPVTPDAGRESSAPGSPAPAEGDAGPSPSPSPAPSGGTRPGAGATEEPATPEGPGTSPGAGGRPSAEAGGAGGSGGSGGSGGAEGSDGSGGSGGAGGDGAGGGVAVPEPAAATG